MKAKIRKIINKYSQPIHGIDDYILLNTNTLSACITRRRFQLLVRVHHINQLIKKVQLNIISSLTRDPPLHRCFHLYKFFQNQHKEQSLQIFQLKTRKLNTTHSFSSIVQNLAAPAQESHFKLPILQSPLNRLSMINILNMKKMAFLQFQHH